MTSRVPTWSGPLTRRVARWIPANWRPAALVTIKAVHTAIFASIGAAIALFAWDGLRQRPRRRSAWALAIFLGESVLYLSNNQVCPLTPVAEDLGAERGAVADMFLPPWAALRIPVVGTSVAVAGLLLHAVALLRR